MRAIIRILINVVLLAATVAAVGKVTTLGVYHGASAGARAAMLAGVCAAGFAAACLVLHYVPSSAQLRKRQQSGGRRVTSPYAAAKRR